MSELRLVIFDVDGTLVDSQGDIVAAMTSAYATEGIQAPSRQDVLSIVGLSLPEAFLRLMPDADEALRTRLVEAYKNSFNSRRSAVPVAQSSPLFPGAREALAELAADPWTLLAVATGKSRRGLDKLIEGHDLTGLFTSQQVADHHPSKPNPSMIHACLSETGVSAARAVMIGDTTFDMEMARSAGVGAIGVSWGYHPSHLLGADHMIDSFAALSGVVDAMMRANA